MDSESLLQRDIEILRHAQSPAKNMSVLLLFFVAISAVLVGLLCVAISQMPGWIMFAVIIGYIVADSFLKLGEKAMIIGMALASAVIGILTLVVVAQVFMQGSGG